MIKTTIIGNWKMNKGPQETRLFYTNFAALQWQEKLDDSLLFGLCVPFVNLSIEPPLSSKSFLLGAQTISEHSSGAYTGETSAAMVRESGAQIVILGHSERRALFNESSAIVNLKIKAALKSNLAVILCIGETLKEQSLGQTKSVIKKQLVESLGGISDLQKIIIAYEPVWAIGSGKHASPEEAQETCAFIRSLTDKQVTILYGGSVSASNLKSYLKEPDVNGALVGGSSLKADDFFELLKIASSLAKK